MKIRILLLLSLFASLAVLALTQQPTSLGEVAARFRAAKGGTASPSQPFAAPIANRNVVSEPCCVADIDLYSQEVGALLVQGRYAELDSIAHRLRTSKMRFPGGVWLLHAFYNGLDKPARGDRATDQEWADHLQRLDAWLKAKPESVTAHIAFANGYMAFGWRARGGGYAGSVSDRGWKLFAGMAEIAHSRLLEAEKLDEKCPEWFNSMLAVALMQGWELQDAKNIVDRAMQFEPSYYYTYREFANFLAPKWYGEEGDSERFAEGAANQIGGKLGDAMYAEIAPTLYCLCEGEPIGKMDFQRIIRGYAADEALYGVSLEKINKLAYIATGLKEKAEAKKAFDRLGENWDLTTWRSKAKYDQARQWANGEQAQNAPAK
jgi:hypothetical protein